MSARERRVIMSNKDLAELLYPNITKTIEDLEKLYPERDLASGAEVCRFAPSPTGRMHMGNLYASFIPEAIANQTNGVFILRIEDTDNKRAIENGIELILEDLKHYNYIVHEDPISGGEYGPYIQTERKEIYHIVAKYLVSIGRAYPCFCTEEDLTNMREHQEKRKARIGYYDKYAKCRNLSYEEVKERIENGDKWVLRLKSMGDFNKKFTFKDLVKGTIELPENDIDQVLVKSDGIPPYAFAHVCDDHFMRVTTVTRDDSYISSVPYHLELWDACGFKAPKFAHLLPINKKEGETVRKISKRKDPEAAVSFYHEKGIPVEAVKLYFATIMNSNFEGWFLQNSDKSYREFEFAFNKMSKSGPIFDLDKLINISKNYISKLKAVEVYEESLKWAKEFDSELADLLIKYKDYSIKLFNIEREQKKPRKDFAMYSEIKQSIWYMYNELFDGSTYEEEVDNLDIIKDYFDNYYDEFDTKEEWYNKIKELAPKYGYAKEVKEYKENPEAFKGHVGDICEMIRYAITSLHQTPDLYEIEKLLGKEEIQRRLDLMQNKNELFI